MLCLCLFPLQAGILEEMMDDTLESLDEDQDELEEEADAEVDEVLYQLTEGKMGVLNSGEAVPGLPVSRIPLRATRPGFRRRNPPLKSRLTRIVCSSPAAGLDCERGGRGEGHAAHAAGTARPP